MCRRNYYAIFDETINEVKAIVGNHRELTVLMTGMYQEGYTYSMIDRKEARRLNKELSDRVRHN